MKRAAEAGGSDCEPQPGSITRRDWLNTFASSLRGCQSPAALSFLNEAHMAYKTTLVLSGRPKGTASETYYQILGGGDFDSTVIDNARELARLRANCLGLQAQVDCVRVEQVQDVTGDPLPARRGLPTQFLDQENHLPWKPSLKSLVGAGNLVTNKNPNNGMTLWSQLVDWTAECRGVSRELKLTLSTHEGIKQSTAYLAFCPDEVNTVEQDADVLKQSSAQEAISLWKTNALSNFLQYLQAKPALWAKRTIDETVARTPILQPNAGNPDPAVGPPGCFASIWLAGIGLGFVSNEKIRIRGRNVQRRRKYAKTKQFLGGPELNGSWQIDRVIEYPSATPPYTALSLVCTVGLMVDVCRPKGTVEPITHWLSPITGADLGPTGQKHRGVRTFV